MRGGGERERKKEERVREKERAKENESERERERDRITGEHGKENNPEPKKLVSLSKRKSVLYYYC